MTRPKALNCEALDRRMIEAPALAIYHLYLAIHHLSRQMTDEQVQLALEAMRVDPELGAVKGFEQTLEVCWDRPDRPIPVETPPGPT